MLKITKCKKYISMFISLSLFFLVIGQVTYAFDDFNSYTSIDKNGRYQETLADGQGELSLKQAIQLAFPIALQWNKEARLMSCESIDIKQKTDEYPVGNYGKRKYWNVQFGVLDTNKLYVVVIHNGKVVQQKDITAMGTRSSSAGQFINLSQILYDSPVLLKKAKKIYHLYPGKGWAKGYNFRVTKDPARNITIISVYGWDKNQQKMKIIPFNATTGKVLS